MTHIAHTASREDISKRLRRIEGQLRGVVRMIDEDTPCMEVAQQLSAARKALDSVFARMTVCYLSQELEPLSKNDGPEFERILADVGTLLRRMS